MVRLLIVLAIVAVAVVMTNFRSGKDGAPPQRPEETMRQQTENIDALEKSLQEQAAQQLQRIDDTTSAP